MFKRSKSVPNFEHQPKAGRGFKVCPECQATVGSRSKKCSCGHIFNSKGHKPKVTISKPTSKIIDREEFARAMIRLGWKFEKTINGYTGEVIGEVVPETIKALRLEFTPIYKNSADRIYVIQTEPEIQVAMSIERFFRLAEIHPEDEEP